ncbi:ATP-binding cassette sub-family G member 1 [Tribolium castaneum]|uniref:ATP-binding cassette sub-family G member 1 n=1 Tax=Tribolium castaneum TaxID=7070 RepID=UPI0030FE971D
MDVSRTLFLQLPKEKTIDIEFDNVTYSVPEGRKGRKQIVKGVCGKFKAGELTAIMGPSGAGKTSLLNILTGFQTVGMHGVIKSTHDKEVRFGAQQYKKQSCYILQDDQLAPLFTVAEIMNMAADLKLGHSISSKRKCMLIDDILDTLGLSTAKDTRCQRLSGGQKKRLSIALELIDNPPIMFLDEPTTGLDSSSSAQCISMLKELARGGRTIICTIHQPSATLYEMFDHVYVMAEGKCIYQGASQNTVTYLSSIGFNCPQYHNPADYLLEVANGEYGNFTDFLAKAATENQWRTAVTSDKLENKINEKTENTVENAKTYQHTQPPSELFKFYILVKRSFLQMYRDWTISHLKILLHFLVGIVLGLNYYQSGNDGSKTISNVGFFIVSSVYLTYTSLMPAVLKFPSELAVLKKERFNNWYKLKTYYAAFLMSDVPMQIIFCMSYISTSYFLSDQPSESFRFFMVVGILILLSLTASSLGLVIGTLVNPINGTFFGAIITAVMLCFAGFLILFTHMSKPMYMMTYVSFLAYSYEGLVQAVYGFNRPSIPCPEEVEYCHLKVPELILRELGMTNNTYWTDVAFLFGNFLLLRIVAFCTLKRRLRTG